MLYTHVAQTSIVPLTFAPNRSQVVHFSPSPLPAPCSQPPLALSQVFLPAISLSHPTTLYHCSQDSGVFWKHKSDLLCSCLILFTVFLQWNSQPRNSGLQNLAWPSLPSLFTYPPSHSLSCSPLVSIQFLRLYPPCLYTRRVFCGNFLSPPLGAWSALLTKLFVSS